MIPVNTPLLAGKELDYVRECIETGWISSEGPFVQKFEQQFADYCQRAHGIAVANGTAALEIAVKALGIGPGDEVIMPSFTIISCAGAVVKAGAVPVLIDAEPDSWNMNTADIAAKITPRTKAIMVVHIYGLPVDMQPVIDLARQHNLKIIEDFAETIGLTWRGQICGSFGDISCASFYPNKHITTGEGGMILVNDPALATKCRDYRNLCFLPGRRFVHEELGWNYRMTNIQAALGLAQLENIDHHLIRKREIGRRYHARLSRLEKIICPKPANADAENIYWVFGIIAKTAPAAKLMQMLATHHIGTRPFFLGMHEQPVFKNMGLFADETYPVSTWLAEHGFYLPSGLGLSDADIDHVCDVMEQIHDQL